MHLQIDTTCASLSHADADAAGPATAPASLSTSLQSLPTSPTVRKMSAWCSNILEFLWSSEEKDDAEEVWGWQRMGGMALESPVPWEVLNSPTRAARTGEVKADKALIGGQGAMRQERNESAFRLQAVPGVDEKKKDQ